MTIYDVLRDSANDLRIAHFALSDRGLEELSKEALALACKVDELQKKVEPALTARLKEDA